MTDRKLNIATAGHPLGKKAIERLNRTGIRNIPATVQPKPENAHAGGQWVCADCGEAIQNNMTAASHNRRHKLAWWTGEHLEEP